jgi:hypothetical protein
MKAYIKEIWKFGPMWQTKYASAVPKNLGVGVDFPPFSEGDFLTGHPSSMVNAICVINIPPFFHYRINHAGFLRWIVKST